MIVVWATDVSQKMESMIHLEVERITYGNRWEPEGKGVIKEEKNDKDDPGFLV